jgi:hypothetical protein
MKDTDAVVGFFDRDHRKLVSFDVKTKLCQKKYFLIYEAQEIYV